MKSFIAKRVISILVNLRYLRFKLLKCKENNKKICNTFDNVKNIPLYIMRKVSIERYYFFLYDGALTLIMSKMALNPFCDETLHIQLIFTNTSILRGKYTFSMVSFRVALIGLQVAYNVITVPKPYSWFSMLMAWSKSLWYLLKTPFAKYNKAEMCSL